MFTGDYIPTCDEDTDEERETLPDDYIPTCDEDIAKVVDEIEEMWYDDLTYVACGITRYWDLPEELAERTSVRAAERDFGFAVATQIDLMGDERFERTVEEFNELSYEWFESWKADWTRETNAAIDEYFLTQNMATRLTLNAVVSRHGA